jgi:8-oxo-dGTP pyrophosphatase MutT (NUDIX family)
MGAAMGNKYTITYDYQGIRRTLFGRHKPLGPELLHETGAHAKEGERLHPIVVVIIKNKEGKYLLQKRSKAVTSPGMLDFAVGGHVDYGETIEKAAIRESEEELGIRLRKLRITTPEGARLTSNEKHLIFVVEAEYKGEIKPGEEVDQEGTRFYSLDEIREKIKNEPGTLKSGIKNYFKKLLNIE